MECLGHVAVGDRETRPPLGQVMKDGRPGRDDGRTSMHRSYREREKRHPTGLLKTMEKQGLAAACTIQKPCFLLGC